jgi:hypothetical protein
MLLKCGGVQMIRSQGAQDKPRGQSGQSFLGRLEQHGRRLGLGKGIQPINPSPRMA